MGKKFSSLKCSLFSCLNRNFKLEVRAGQGRAGQKEKRKEKEKEKRRQGPSSLTNDPLSRRVGVESDPEGGGKQKKE